jgi:hypothetical protein
MYFLPILPTFTADLIFLGLAIRITFCNCVPSW